MARIVIWISFAVLTGCGFSPKKVNVADPQVQLALRAAAEFDREKYGFFPLPTQGEVFWEDGHKAYDVMLHLYGKTSRTISFRKTDQGYQWIGEQEIFTGLKEYTTVDGTALEEICLTFETAQISGSPLNQLAISYNGPDPRLLKGQNLWNSQLKLEDIQPILKEWGY